MLSQIGLHCWPGSLFYAHACGVSFCVHGSGVRYEIPHGSKGAGALASSACLKWYLLWDIVLHRELSKGYGELFLCSVQEGVRAI
jgi:hypothetical protein